MDACRGHRLLVRDKRWFIAHRNSCSQSISICVGSLIPNSQKEIPRGLDDMCTQSAVHFRKRTPSIGNPNLLILINKYVCPLFWRKALAPSSKAVHYINILEKIVGTKSQWPCSQTYRYSVDPWKIPTQRLPPLHSFALFNFSPSSFYFPAGKM